MCLPSRQRYPTLPLSFCLILICCVAAVASCEEFVSADGFDAIVAAVSAHADADPVLLAGVTVLRTVLKTMRASCNRSAFSSWSDLGGLLIASSAVDAVAVGTFAVLRAALQTASETAGLRLNACAVLARLASMRTASRCPLSLSFSRSGGVDMCV
jgi:hypothetical protein